VLKLGYLKKQSRHIFEVLKCGAGRGWRRSVGPIKWKMKKYYIESRRKWTSYNHTYIKQRKAKLVIPCIGSTLLKLAEGKHVDGKIEGLGRQGRRHNQLMDDLKETRQYWKLRGEALHCTLWRTYFGRDYGPVVMMMMTTTMMILKKIVC